MLGLKGQAVKGTLGTILGIFLVWGVFCSVARAEGLDLYVVYTGKYKKEKDRLLSVLPKDLTVKAYNTDFLVLADYSGKQKAITRFEKARMIVVIHEAPMRPLKGARVKTALLIINSLKNTVTSQTWTLHVVAKGKDLADLDKGVKILKAETEADLADGEVIRSSKVVLVNEESLELFKAVSLIATNFLGR